MSNGDWYPKGLAARVALHANLSVQATATGLTHGLIAAQITQIAADSAEIATIVNYLTAVDTFSQAVTEYKELMLDGPLGTALPPVPTVPATIAVALGAAAAIQARTRQYRAIILASVGYTPEIGELYGLLAPAAGPLADPAIARATPTQGTSDVVLNLAKGGYDVIAVDMRRAGGGWVQIGVSQTATFTDTTPPLVAGQPEQREYRCQGMLNNARTGDLSAVVSAVTVP